jgi:hypothetical protein
VFGVTAALTTEPVLRGSVVVADEPAAVASLAGVAGIDLDERNSCPFSLVSNELTKLSESPTLLCSNSRAVFNPANPADR